MKYILSILLFLSSFQLVRAEKRAFTIADLYKIKSITDVQISPDGKRVAFVVTQYFLEKGTSNSDIYIMNTDGSNIRRMTRQDGTDDHPRWSPDGSKLLFISDRSGNSQIWEIPVSGGDSKQLTDFAMATSKPLWSPAGKAIAFAARVFPECGASSQCNGKINKSMEEGSLQAHMADHLFYRHWDFWKDGKRNHIQVVDLNRKNIIDVTPGHYDSPSFSLEGGTGYDFSPDGSQICFVSNHDKNPEQSTNQDLWVVPVNGGEIRNLTARNLAYDGDPKYSPDGRFIAYRMQTIPGYESDRFRLAVFNRENGQRDILTPDFDYWVEDIEWAPDSKSIYFTADVEGHVPLYHISLNSKKITKVIDSITIDFFQITPDGKWIILGKRSVAEPREVWKVRTDGKNPMRLTFFNRGIEDSVDIRPAEEMWIPLPNGAKIHTFVIKPHDFDPRKKYPLILNVHGGPQQQWEDAFRGDWQVYPGSGYVVAFPNPHGSVGYGQAFTAEISKDWGGKVYQDIMAVTDSLSRISWIDKDRMGAMGWSYGGYMMMWLEGHTDRFQAIASMMGVYDLVSMYGATEELWFPQWDLGGAPWETPEIYKEWSPSNYVENFKTPCQVITGEKDFRVPYTQSLEFFTALRKMGVPSRLIVYKNDGHWPDFVKSMPFYYNAHLDWFHRYLGGDEAPYDMERMWRNMVFE